MKLWLLAVAFSAHAQFAPPAEAPALHEEVYSQAVDHFGQVQARFDQRYWIDSEFATSADAPVLLRLCGEGEGEGFIPDASISHAQALHAHVIYLEHRYYGASQPLAATAPDRYRFLTMAEILADIAEFETFAQSTLGLKGPWIALGGSYSGTLAALYRFKYPQMTVGALAASAPMFEEAFSEVGASDQDARKLIARGFQPDPWTYQSCTDFTFWSADPDSGEIFRPGAALCRMLFNLQTPADWQAYNQNDYEPFIRPPTAGSPTASNILFTNGDQDVWSRVSIDPAHNHNPLIFTRLIPGAGHHFDLNAPDPSYDTADVLSARNYFLTLVQQWIKKP